MSFQRVLVGASVGFAAVMLTLAGYVALDTGSGRDLAEVQRSAEMVDRIEHIHSDVTKNLARAQALAEAARATRGDLDAQAAQAAFAVGDEPAAAVPEAPQAPEDDAPPAEAPVVRLDASPLHGVATGPGGNVAIIAGDVYRVGDLYGALRVVDIHRGGVLFETAAGEKREKVLAGWTPNRKTEK